MKKLLTLLLVLVLGLALTGCGSKDSDSISIAVPNDTTNEARALTIPTVILNGIPPIIINGTKIAINTIALIILVFIISSNLSSIKSILLIVKKSQIKCTIFTLIQK